MLAGIRPESIESMKAVSLIDAAFFVETKKLQVRLISPEV
jgi:hypothetical protein